MGVSVGNLFKENYKINNRSYTVTANFKEETLNIRGYKFIYDCHIDEYTGFEGNMSDFVKSKVNA